MRCTHNWYYFPPFPRIQIRFFSYLPWYPPSISRRKSTVVNRRRLTLTLVHDTPLSKLWPTSNTHFCQHTAPTRLSSRVNSIANLNPPNSLPQLYSNPNATTPLGSTPICPHYISHHITTGPKTSCLRKYLFSV